MELTRLIECLSDPAAYPDPPGAVEVRQTHISVVFLAGAWVYKVKKPVAPGFLDFTTLEKRRHFCEEEVRLNRRLAPDVYAGVVPIVRAAVGLRFEGDGEAVEWAVKMRRLPADATLLEMLRRGEVEEPLVRELARRVAAFYRGAESGDRAAAFGRFEVVARNFRDVLDRGSPAAGEAVARGVLDRVRSLAEETLTRLRPLIEARASRGVPRDCHGDLHLDHVYHLPDREPPGDLVVIDCIEFNEQFRLMDPVADAAFAAMDLAFRGRRDLARAFADEYFRAGGDDDGRALLPLYAGYRAAVRGMVDGLLRGEQEVPAGERAAALTRARGHWLLALAELETPERRPGLVLVAGLPGTGKSTLARSLGETAGFAVLRSDVVRKELAGMPDDQPAPAPLRESLYSPESTDRVYAELMRRAEDGLTRGERILVDANLREDRRRVEFVRLALRCGVPVAVLVCEASPETVRSRLAARRGDASDADWGVYQRVAAEWEEPGAEAGRVTHRVTTDGPTDDAIARARDALAAAELLD